MYPEDTSRSHKVFDTRRRLLPMKWYDRAKGRMADLGINQADLAPVLGVQKAAVSHYLTGKREPSPAQLVALAARLQVSLDTLLVGGDSPAPSQTERPDFDKIAAAITLLSEYVEVTGGPDELVSDATAIEIAYEVVEAFGMPIAADNVLSLTKLLGKRIRGETNEDQRALRAARKATGNKGR